jgi:FG-GAP-like repeat
MIRLRKHLLCGAAAWLVATLSGCSSSPALSITSPADQAKLGPADDLDAAAPGVQIAVDALTDAADGSEAAAQAGASRAITTVRSGRIHFDAVTIADGAQALSVQVVDRKSNRWSTAAVNVTADSMAAGCRFTSPADHTVVTADPGDTGFVVQEVDVLCRGLAEGTAVGLTVGDSPGPLYTKPLGSDGVAAFQVKLLEGENLLGLIAPGAPLKLLSITLAPPTGSPTRCSGTFQLPSGTLFNLAGGGGAVADTDPAKSGIQARLVVAEIPVGCEGEPASLVLSQGAQSSTYPGTVASGQVAFDVDLFDGADHVTAFVGRAGSRSAQLRPVDYTADGVPVTASLTSPVAGAILTDRDNLSASASTFQAAFTGAVTGAGAAGSEAFLLLDEGTAQVQHVALAGRLDNAGAFTNLAVTLSAGAHTARVWARRPSGNFATTASIPFAVVFNGGALSIVSPADGAVLGKGPHVQAVTGGDKLDFVLRSRNLAGAQVQVTCLSQDGVSSQGSAALTTADTTVQVFVPASCGPVSLTCSAQATPSSGSPAYTAPIAILVDAVAPQVTLNAPASGATRNATFELLATTDCPGEAQTASISVAGVAQPSQPVVDNAIDVKGLALSPGQNPIVLTVTDAAGNASVATAQLNYLQGAPQVLVTAPADGTTLTQADDLDQDLSNGLQVNVQVQVPNRPGGTPVSLVLSSSAGARFQQTAFTSTSTLAATFASTSLPEGRVTLSATVTDVVVDAAQPPPVTATSNVLVSTGRPLCDVLVPQDHTVWSPLEDSRPDLPGFQHGVSVQTSAAGQVTITLTPLSGTSTPVSTFLPAAGSGLQTVTFNDLTFTDGAWSVSATCAQASGPSGRALPNQVSLNLTGPTVAFTRPAAGASFGRADFDASGNALVQLAVTSGDGGVATLSWNCGVSTGSATSTVSAGAASFRVPLLPDASEATCTLMASAANQARLAGVPVQVLLLADRSAPSPQLLSPQSGGYAPDSANAALLDCSNPGAPAFGAVQVLLVDPVPAAGLQLSITGPSGSSTVWSGTPSASATSTGGQSATLWTWSNVAVSAGTSVLSVQATDAAGNGGTSAQSTVAVRCTAAGVELNFLGVSAVNNVSRLGYAQDHDHTTAGEQATVVVNAAAANGSAIRVCSSAASGTTGAACATAGYRALTTSVASPTIQGSTATFDITVPEGAQSVIAEVDAQPTATSTPRNVIAHSQPPHVIGLAVLDDINGDGALDQAELDAATSTIRFRVDVGALSYVSGLPVEIWSTASSSPLGTLTASSNGAASFVVQVPKATLTGAGGYQGYVFYARLLDEAGNFSSTPGSVYPGDTLVTLGTQAKPFMIAPRPTLTLTAPASSVTVLNAANDSRCTPGPCPGVAPLSYALSASTNAPDGSTLAFLLDGTVVASVSTSGGVASNVLGLLSNGLSRRLNASISDPYGNVVTTLPLTLLIDSVPPLLTLSDPADGAIINNIYPYPGTVSVSASGTLEAGQPFSVISDLSGLVGNGIADGSVTLPVSLRLTSGTHHLYATASDVAGNVGVSPINRVTQILIDPTIAFSAPAPTAGIVWFGLSTKVGSKAQPALQTSSTNVPDGTQVELWVNATSNCSSTPPANAATSTVAGGLATFTGLLTFNDKDAGYLCAQVTTLSGKTAHAQGQQFQCDLATPVLSFVNPAAGASFVAFLQTVSGATSNALSDTSKLFTDVSFGSLSAPTGGTLKVYVDATSTAFTSAAVLSSDTSKDLGQPGIPIAQGAASTAHTLYAQLVAPSGNASAFVSRAIAADIAPPGAVPASFTVTSALTGVVHVSISGVPLDDGTVGSPAPGWDVRWLAGSTALDSNSWGNATKAQNLAGSVPSTTGTTSFDVLLPTDQSNLWLGVRAVDRAGNLGAFTALAAPNVSTSLARGGPVQPPNADINIAPILRVADVDGDGYDDVIVVYNNDVAPGSAASGAFGDGQIYIFFGGASGLGATPMRLSPSQLGVGITMGAGHAFDVGDLDGDGKADILAGESFCDPTTSFVDVWTGASIAAARAASSTPARIQLRESTAGTSLGGTIRMVGKVTGGSAPGSDLLVSNYSFYDGCTVPAAPSLTLLPRASVASWLVNGNSTLLSGTAGAVTVALPTSTASDPDAASFDKHGASSRDSLAVAFVGKPLVAFSGDLLTGTVAWSGGVTAAASPGAGPAFANVISGGRDALGSATTDLVVADTENKRVLVYDGDALLTAGAVAVASATLDPSVDTNGDVGRCAVLLPDLDGDGKAEYSGCADTSKAGAAYFAFGFSGAAEPWTLPFFPAWSFAPARAQKLFSSPSGAVWGQAVAAGHVADKARNDLVILSHASTGHDSIYWVH